MTVFTVHTVESAPEASRQPLDELRQRVGFVPNLAGHLAGSPVAIDAFNQLQRALRHSTLTAAEREVVGLTVSVANRCAWSVAAHTAFAEGAGLAPEVIEALRAGKDDLTDERATALCAFTRAVLRSGGLVGEAEPAGMLVAGFSPEQVLEVITQAAFTSMANWVANVIGTPLDAALASRAWEG
ncbi:carboxymuconolactone decarboxylase family protein [Nonomuraea gerenzanensis]|uniref:Macrophage infectivity potentiator-related protein n=1 Tax=Nonomuraea gerenzanensis TaxID=93944 RepID=A0A1M4E4D5_9ACTN|nr:peroxidase-related enzyme [Nonomuraea gerenzanensis]UBU15902.1 peroxidase-related enzyme [Nonomuraea gerenzanensis]SBO93697.1 Macrophage infectivity potentiator-related protein [Nonomuraea gerenzanensis]